MRNNEFAFGSIRQNRRTSIANWLRFLADHGNIAIPRRWPSMSISCRLRFQFHSSIRGCSRCVLGAILSGWVLLIITLLVFVSQVLWLLLLVLKFLRWAGSVGVGIFALVTQVLFQWAQLDQWIQSTCKNFPFYDFKLCSLFEKKPQTKTTYFGFLTMHIGSLYYSSFLERIIV